MCRTPGAQRGDENEYVPIITSLEFKATGIETPASYNEAMRELRRSVPVAVALILGFTSSSCLYTKRVILRRGKPVTANSAPVLRNSTREGLTSRIANIYNAINSFQATVDMTPSLGSVYKGEITEIKDIRGYVLFRKPADIRIIGQLPVVRSNIFDMVSDGNTFKLNLVTKSLFVVGSNAAPPASSNSLENLRPQAFLSSMLIQPTAPDEQVFLEDDTDEENALYILHFIKRGPDGQPIPDRSVWFDRIDLSIVRQKTFDPDGNTVSDTRYSKWQIYNGVAYPGHIDLNRDKEGYGVVIDIIDMQMNRSLTNEQFQLAQPEGTQLKTIGSPAALSPAGTRPGE